MKTSVFEFGLRFATNGKDLLSLVERAPSRIQGVDRIEINSNGYFATIRVLASFPDANAAKKLHRRLINALTRIDGVTITHVSSNLTDVFD